MALDPKKNIAKKENIVKKTLRITFILFLYSAFYIPHSAFSSSLFTNDCIKNPKEHVVKEVFDGDTILVRGERSEVRGERSEVRGENQKQKNHASHVTPHTSIKIRLLGIDAFEYDQLPYGKIGKDYLTKLVLNKNVCVETDEQETDVYGRTLGYVFITSPDVQMSRSLDDKSSILLDIKTSRHQDIEHQDNLFINEELLKNGLALLYDFPPNTKYIQRLKKAQIYARKNMIGIWEKQNYILETPAQWRKKNKNFLRG